MDGNIPQIKNPTKNSLLSMQSFLRQLNIVFETGQNKKTTKY